MVLLIENKIGGKQAPGQLARYRKVVGHEFPAFKLVPVFLTLEGESGEDEEASKYIAYSHASLLCVLERIIKQRRKQMPEAVATFLDQYRNTLRRLTMQDKALVELCQKIYRKHREAIKLIVEYGEFSIFSQLASEILGRDGECEILHTGPKILSFIPTSWAKVVPENSTVWTHLSRPVSVVCWIGLWPTTRLSLVFEVSRMDDPALRMACVKALSENGFKLTKRPLRKMPPIAVSIGILGRCEIRAMRKSYGDAIDSLVGKAKEQFPKWKRC